MAYLVAAMRTKRDNAIDNTISRMCAVWKCIVSFVPSGSVEGLVRSGGTSDALQKQCQGTQELGKKGIAHSADAQRQKE